MNDCLYVYYDRQAEIDRTDEIVHGQVFVDYDRDGKVVGVELLGFASLGSDVPARIKAENDRSR